MVVSVVPPRHSRATALTVDQVAGLYERIGALGGTRRKSADEIRRL
eukprot:gene14445-12155_t